MQAYVVPVQVGNLPIQMECAFPQGLVRFQRLVAFPAFFDLDGEILGFYNDSGFHLEPPVGAMSQEFFYGQWYEYKKIPMLLKWLQQFKLANPVPVEKEA